MTLRPFSGATGASVITVVLLISIITAAGAVFLSLLSTGTGQSTAEVTSARAFYAAEGGAEAAIGHLNRVSWTWRDGYSGKTLGNATVDVEVLEYESRDSVLSGASRCERIQSSIIGTGSNPARTVYANLAWSSGNNMGLELYDNAVADCANPLGSANLLASSDTANMPERLRYRITAAAPATLTYTVRVTGTPGDSYKLRIAHPDEPGFGAAYTCGQAAGRTDQCLRAVISRGRSGASVREIFAGVGPG